MSTILVYKTFSDKCSTTNYVNLSKRSQLFYLIDYLCRHNFSCTNAPMDESEYIGRSHSYEYHNRRLQLSVLKEESGPSETKFFYLCFSFPMNSKFYYVKEISAQFLPSFSPAEKKNDLRVIDYLCDTVTAIFENFCQIIVKKNRWTLEENTSAGIEPSLDLPVKKISPSTKKRKKETTPSTSPTKKKTEHSIHPFFERLCRLNQEQAVKPDQISRLFALLHELWLSLGHTSSLPSEGWPGGLQYNNEVINIYFHDLDSSAEDSKSKDSTVDVDTESPNESDASQTEDVENPKSPDVAVQPSEELSSDTIPIVVMNVSLLNNSEEYYLCLRSTMESDRKHVFKLDRNLVPSLDINDLHLDCQRIENLTIWSRSIIRDFVKNRPTCLSTSVSSYKSVLLKASTSTKS